MEEKNKVRKHKNAVRKKGGLGLLSVLETKRGKSHVEKAEKSHARLEKSHVQ
jgi:hypothetical protein